MRTCARAEFLADVIAGVTVAMVAVMMLLAGYMVMPALAGLLILTAWNMAEPQKWRGYMQGRVSDRVLLVLTVVVDLTVAIGVGVALGLALRLRRRGAPPVDWSPPDR